MENYGRAKVVAVLVEVAEKLKEALHGAQLAKDFPLFEKILTKQDEIIDLASSLVK